MTPFVADPDFTLWHGDVREVLPTLEPESVDCALTSPPFYALRDYGVDGQIGLEASPEEWVSELVGVFREVRRVLRPSGTLWVECGDSYGSGGHNGKGFVDGGEQTALIGQKVPRVVGLKPKDLLGQPWMLAFALRADGWYLRQCIVWAKPNAMPESVRDRCTTAHSYLFLLSKSPRYWFDADAIAEPAAWERWGDQTVPKHEGTATAAGWIKPNTKKALLAEHGDVSNHRLASTTQNNHSRDLGRETGNGSKNARSVWSIPTQGFAEAHFATWPEALVERVLKAGCPEWVCGTCGKARERIVNREYADDSKLGEWQQKASNNVQTGGIGKNFRSVTAHNESWSDCGHGNYRPGTCLDPFMGSGTTALVARRLGRHAVGVELNEDYCGMAARRLSQLSLLA